jgi:hypothetical protein
MFVPESGCYYLQILYGAKETPGTYFAAGK